MKFIISILFVSIIGYCLQCETDNLPGKYNLVEAKANGTVVSNEEWKKITLDVSETNTSNVFQLGIQGTNSMSGKLIANNDCSSRTTPFITTLILPHGEMAKAESLITDLFLHYEGFKQDGEILCFYGNGAELKFKKV